MAEETKNQEVEENVEESTAEEVEKTEKDNKTQQDSGNKIPYERFEQVINEKNEYKRELEQLKDKLAEMEDPEELKKEYEGKLEDLSNKSIKRQKEFAVKEAALAENVNKKALNDFVKVADIDSLEVDDEGNVTGVSDLIANMKDEKDYFFQKESKSNQSTAGNFNDTQAESEEKSRDGENKLRKLMGLPTK